MLAEPVSACGRFQKTFSTSVAAGVMPADSFHTHGKWLKQCRSELDYIAGAFNNKILSGLLCLETVGVYYAVSQKNPC